MKQLITYSSVFLTSCILLALIGCEKSDPPIIEEPIIEDRTIDELIGHYLGVCYHEQTHLNNLNQPVISYDTTHQVEIDVTFVETLRDTIFIVQVGPETPLDLTQKHISRTELKQDTISEHAVYGNYSHLAEWIPAINQLYTKGKSGSYTYYYTQAKCYYQKVE